MEYQICRRCIMDNKSDPLIIFDKDGICNHCHDFDERISRLPKTAEDRDRVFNTLISEMKEHGKGKEFDCVLGISGGVPPSFELLLVSLLESPSGFSGGVPPLLF